MWRSPTIASAMSRKDAVAKLKDGEVLLLENTRFHAGEEENDPDFVTALAELGDLYVNDAFSAAHRAHASTEGIAHLLPSAAGRAMQSELEHLHKALGDPKRPVMAVVGGAKVSTKIALLEHLVDKVDMLVIGGAMANTFLAAEGIDVGKSLYESRSGRDRQRIVKAATETGTILILPTDVVVAKEFKANAPHRTVNVREVAADEMILDVGPDTIAEFERRLHTTKTLVWNGPFGAFETPPFDAGTVAAARASPRAPGPAICSRSPAAATPLRRSTMPASRTISLTSRPPAAHFSNGWKARNCRASRRSRPAEPH